MGYRLRHQADRDRGPLMNYVAYLAVFTVVVVVVLSQLGFT